MHQSAVHFVSQKAVNALPQHLATPSPWHAKHWASSSLRACHQLPVSADLIAPENGNLPGKVMSSLTFLYQLFLHQFQSCIEVFIKKIFT